jgi:HPt (histidine-containing phosphotransfer) domain-containing protein
MNIDPTIYNSLKNVLFTSGQFHTICEMFRINNDSRIQNIIDSLETGDVAQAGRSLHALKGSCRMFGELDCADACERIETNLATANITPTQENIKEIKILLENFSQFLKSESTGAPSSDSESVAANY